MKYFCVALSSARKKKKKSLDQSLEFAGCLSLFSLITVQQYSPFWSDWRFGAWEDMFQRVIAPQEQYSRKSGTEQLWRSHVIFVIADKRRDFLRAAAFPMQQITVLTTCKDLWVSTARSCHCFPTHASGFSFSVLLCPASREHLRTTK